MPISLIYVSRCKYTELRTVCIASLLGDSTNCQSRVFIRFSPLLRPHFLPYRAGVTNPFWTKDNYEKPIIYREYSSVGFAETKTLRFFDNKDKLKMPIWAYSRRCYGSQLNSSRAQFSWHIEEAVGWMAWDRVPRGTRLSLLYSVKIGCGPPTPLSNGCPRFFPRGQSVPACEESRIRTVELLPPVSHTSSSKGPLQLC